MAKKNRKQRRLARKKARNAAALQDKGSVAPREVTLDDLAQDAVSVESVDSSYVSTKPEVRYGVSDVSSDPLENIGTAIQGIRDANNQINQGMADLYGRALDAHRDAYDAQLEANLALSNFMADSLSGKYDEPKPLEKAAQGAVSKVGLTLTGLAAAAYLGFFAWGFQKAVERDERCRPFRAKLAVYHSLSPEEQAETEKPYLPNKCKPKLSSGGLV